MMIQRKASRGPTIRTLLEEAEDTGDDDEKEITVQPVEMVETITVSSVQTTDSVAATVNPARPRQRLVRRSSSAVDCINIPVVQEEIQDGGDKSLRPRFLQERSATIVHITPAAVDPLREPRSKASAFLMDVLAKSKEYSGAEGRRGSLEPLRRVSGVTNTLQYVPPQGVERGQHLRMAGRSSRRVGRQVSNGLSSDLLDGGTPTGARKCRLSGSQERMGAIVRALQASKQHLHPQLDILHSVVRFIDASERDDDGKRSVIKEMVDEGMIPELASIMREFRFSTDLQLCVMNILSALVEESAVYAYMMSEFNLEKLIQKTAAVHASQDRLIMLASTLVHAIEDSKHSINIQAYRAENAEKVRLQSASYTDMIVAAISAKPKQSLPSPRTKFSTNSGIVAAEIARSRAFIKSASPSGSERENNYSLGRQGQAFALDVAPPMLSTNYRLLFSQQLKKSEVQSVQGAKTTSKVEVSADNHPTKRDRPISSPSKKSLLLDLTSRSLAAAIYSGGLIFVEPSPLAKRMPFRGSFSAGGVPRKLSVPKRNYRAQTQQLPPTHNLSPAQTPPMTERTDSLSEDTLAEAQVIDNTPIEHDTPDEFSRDEGEEKTEEQEAAKDEEKKDDGGEEEESYEDDFDTTGDDTEEHKKMSKRQDSDGELIDILHSMSVQDPGNSTSPTASISNENDPARTIQREYSRPSKATASRTMVQPLEKKTPQVANSKKRGSKSAGIKGKRQLPTQGYSTARDKTIPQERNRSRPVTPASHANMHKLGSSSTKAPVRQRKQETSNQLISPQREVELEDKAEDEQVVKEPLDPEALKTIQELYAEGLQHHKQSHLGLAIDCYEKALTLPGGQDFSSLHVNLGSALMGQNKFSEALKSFEQAKRIQPNNVKAIYNYSVALLHLDRPQEAQRLFRRILELEPSHEKSIIALQHLQGNVR